MDRQDARLAYDRSYVYIALLVVGDIQRSAQVLTFPLIDSLALSRVQQLTFAFGRSSLARSGRYCPPQTREYWRLWATLSVSTLWICSTRLAQIFSPVWIPMV